MIIAVIKTQLGKLHLDNCKVLLDSGATQSIAKYSVLKKLRFKKAPPTFWKTTSCTFSTTDKCRTEFMLPELSTTKRIVWAFHVTKQQMSYDLIIGQDLLRELGIALDFSTDTIQWGDIEMPMKHPTCINNMKEHFNIQDDTNYPSKSDQVKQIFKTNYKPANLDKVIEEAQHLSKS